MNPAMSLKMTWEEKKGAWLKHFVAFLIIFFVFQVTLILRMPHINRPLSAHLEFVTGQVLISLKIWEKEGAGRFRFLPVISYNQSPSLMVREYYTVAGPQGRGYYVSPLPFAYIFPYALAKMIGIAIGPLFLQLVNLACHFLGPFSFTLF